MSKPNEILEQAKDKVAACIVFGINEQGQTQLLASLDNVAFAHWMLNKAAFELCLFERMSTAKAAEQQTADEPAAA